MDRYRVIKGDNHAYLCTIRFVYWLPLFNAGEPIARVVLDSLDFCRRKKGLILHAYVIMIDHIHFIARHNDLSSFVRDFKTWTSKQIAASLEKDGREQWIDLMENRVGAGVKQQRRVWDDGFHPKRIESDAMFLQKLEYVHNNPVRKGFVGSPADWRWSSAANYENKPQPAIEIDLVAPLVV